MVSRRRFRQHRQNDHVIALFLFWRVLIQTKKLDFLLRISLAVFELGNHDDDLSLNLDNCLSFSLFVSPLSRSELSEGPLLCGFTYHFGVKCT